MKNDARYVVTTHWGTFSLDEASYQDYLAGNLWICWTPGKSMQPQQTISGYVPQNVTERAISLRDQADKTGVLATLHRLGIHDALVPYSSRLADLSIDEMNLTVRSSNGLKRANAATFGRLRNLLAMENGILSVRNLGQKSAKEIKQLFFEECYCKNEMFYTAEGVNECFECHKKINKPAVLLFKNYQLPIYNGMKVYLWHVDSTLEDIEAIAGEIVANPQNPQMLGLRNTSTYTWKINLPDGSQKPLAPGSVVPIKDGFVIDFFGNNQSIATMKI